MTISRGRNVENCGNNPGKSELLNKSNNKIIKLIKREDFLAVSSKFRVKTKGLNLQARKRSDEDYAFIKNKIRVGFTCSKKVGNAVKRNIAKRRLRCVARECLPTIGKDGWDYIIIGQYKHTEEIDFEDLKKYFINAVIKIHSFEKSK